MSSKQSASLVGEKEVSMTTPRNTHNPVSWQARSLRSAVFQELACIAPPSSRNRAAALQQRQNDAVGCRALSGWCSGLARKV